MNRMDEQTRQYTVYGDLRSREAVTLATVLRAKGLDAEWVEESASLSMALEARAGGLAGPYLRTPEGFVLADLHAILEWLERVRPDPALLPAMPVRRCCTRILEDWIELWLVHWPRRSWTTLEGLGAHLTAAGFLLGPEPVRADWVLAAWLESEVLIHPHAREHLARNAPRLVSLGDDLLGRPEEPSGNATDDVIPISLLDVLAEVGADYHAYLACNHQALKDDEDEIFLDLGLGERGLPVQSESESRRIELGRELRSLDRTTRRRVAGILEPVGVWHVLTLPPAIQEVDPADPRSL